MRPLVTIAIPIYKRLEYLPGALASVAAQDYPEIELLVSDNGQNGPELRELVQRYYPRPFRMRRNEVTETIMSRHFNQMVESATGKYFVLLCDDDEIGPGFVSNLVPLLEGDEEVALAIPRVQVMDESGKPLALDKPLPPPVFSGQEFVRMWASQEYAFFTFVTVMGRTREIREVGGYPDMPNGDDDAVALKLSLGRKVAFNGEAVFRYRWYEASHGLAVSPWELATDVKRWLSFLDSDPILQEFAARSPAVWEEVHRLMVRNSWRTYRHRWRTMYRERLGRLEWLRAGFALPFIPEYYRWPLTYLVRKSFSSAKRRLHV